MPENAERDARPLYTVTLTAEEITTLMWALERSDTEQPVVADTLRKLDQAVQQVQHNDGSNDVG